MSDDPASALPDPAMLAALDLPDDVRVGVVEQLRLLTEHWRRFAEPGA